MEQWRPSWNHGGHLSRHFVTSYTLNRPLYYWHGQSNFKFPPDTSNTEANCLNLNLSCLNNEFEYRTNLNLYHPKFMSSASMPLILIYMYVVPYLFSLLMATCLSLVHLSQRLIGELIVYPCSGARRPSVGVHNVKQLLL